MLQRPRAEISVLTGLKNRGTADVLMIGREQQSLLRKRDFGALRIQHAIGKA